VYKLFGLAIIGLFLAGVTTLLLAVIDFCLSWGAAAEPQVISAEQLADHGPGGNRHVALRDFDLDDQVVHDAESGKIWIPVRALGSPRVFIKLDGPSPGVNVSALEAAGEIRGMARQDGESLHYEQRTAFRRQNSGVKFDEVWTITYGEAPLGFGRFLLRIGLGLALIGGGFLIALSVDRDEMADGLADAVKGLFGG
jgi:hypothetical protein